MSDPATDKRIKKLELELKDLRRELQALRDSIFESFLAHSFELANNVVFLVPTNKIFQRQKIMYMINKFGKIKGMRIYGSGTSVGFPFGFSVGAFYFAKNYKGGTEIILIPRLTTFKDKEKK